MHWGFVSSDLPKPRHIGNGEQMKDVILIRLKYHLAISIHPCSTWSYFYQILNAFNKLSHMTTANLVEDL